MRRQVGGANASADRATARSGADHSVFVCFVIFRDLFYQKLDVKRVKPQTSWNLPSVASALLVDGGGTCNTNVAISL